MGRNSEIKYREILENKPYLTKKELFLLLEKKGKNLDKKISQLLRRKYLLSLKKGLYTSRIYLLENKDRLLEYLANILYYPSYLSLEYVLQQEGVIPEVVFVYTSVTMKLPRIFTNELGVFSYRKIKDLLFTGYQHLPFREAYQIKKATKAKALFDFFYFKVFKNPIEQELFSDLRINWDAFSKEESQEFLAYVKISDSKKMEKISKILNNRLKW